MSDSNLEKILTHAKAVAVGVETKKTEKPSRVLLLNAPLAELVWKGDKSIVIKAQAVDDVDASFYLADESRVYGIVKISRGKPISLAQLRKTEDVHKIDDELRRKLWPRARRLFEHGIETFEKFDTPQDWNYANTSETSSIETQYTRAPSDDELESLDDIGIESVRNVLSDAATIEKCVETVVEQLFRLTKLSTDVARPLRNLPAMLKCLCDEYQAIAKRLDLDVTPRRPRNVFIMIDELIQKLAISSEYLPKKTRIYALTKDAGTLLNEVLDIETELPYEDAVDVEKLRLSLTRDAEGGIHVHNLERENAKTKQDGLHIHIFMVDENVLVVSEEDGAHEHLLDATDANNTGAHVSVHQHKVVLRDGTVLQTALAGDHSHELQTFSTAFDGAHQHTLMLSDGREITSMTAGQFWRAIGSPEQALNEPAPPASKLAKAARTALEE